MALKILRKVSYSGGRKYSTCININDAYILSAVRTPNGSVNGKLSSLSAVQLGSIALSAALEKSCLSKEEIQEVIFGCVFPLGVGHGLTRQIALYSGLPTSVACSTINKLCGSGLKAACIASQMIISCSQEVVATGGVESLSNVPFFVKRRLPRIGNACLHDTILHDGLNDFFDQTDVTVFAEQSAKEYNITRKDQDEFGLESFRRAAYATQCGIMTNEIVPVAVKKKGEEEEVVKEDEEINKLDLEKYYDLKPDIGKNGTITPGNSGGLADGGAALILASGNFVLKKNLKPLARIVSFADGALEPKQFSISPAIAIPKALLKANLSVGQISMWEINEAYAHTPIITSKLLKIDLQRINVHGGAISLGHPFGQSGARVIVHLAHSLEPGQYGCAAMSHVTGGTSAMVIEKL